MVITCVSAASVLVVLMTVVNVSASTVGGFTVAVVYNCDVAYPTWWRAITRAWAPAVRVDAAGKYRRTVADGVKSVKVRIVVTAAAVVVIAVGVGVIAPLGIAGADVDRTGVSASSAVIT